MKESANRDGGRDTLHLHPSEMSKDDWCPQRSYFRMMSAPTESTAANPSFRMQSAFASGHDAHKKWQRWLSEMGILWGKWKCGCDHTVMGAFTPFDRCRTCMEKWKYVEVPFEDEEYLIWGHADGLVILNAGGTYLIEIKTIGIGTLRFEAPALYEKLMNGTYTIDQTWAAIRKPFASHRMQSQFYLWLLKRQYPEFANVSEMILIYEWKPDGAVKEFSLGATEAVIADKLESAREVALHVNHGIQYRERPDWADPDGAVCSSCEYRNICWNIVEVDDGAPSSVSVRRSTGRGGKRTRVASA